MFSERETCLVRDRYPSKDCAHCSLASSKMDAVQDEVYPVRPLLDVQSLFLACRSSQSDTVIRADMAKPFK